MTIKIECTYCGDIRLVSRESNLSTIKDKCLKCNSKKLKVRDISDEVIDTYVGCPPFPEKEVAKVHVSDYPKKIYNDYPDDYFKMPIMPDDWDVGD